MVGKLDNTRHAVFVLSLLVVVLYRTTAQTASNIVTNVIATSSINITNSTDMALMSTVMASNVEATSPDIFSMTSMAVVSITDIPNASAVTVMLSVDSTSSSFIMTSPVDMIDTSSTMVVTTTMAITSSFMPMTTTVMVTTSNPVAVPTNSKANSGGFGTGAIIGVAAGGGTGCLVVCLIVIFCCWHHHRKHRHQKHVFVTGPTVQIRPDNAVIQPQGDLRDSQRSRLSRSSLTGSLRSLRSSFRRAREKGRAEDIKLIMQTPL